MNVFRVRRQGFREALRRDGLISFQHNKGGSTWCCMRSKGTNFLCYAVATRNKLHGNCGVSLAAISGSPVGRRQMFNKGYFSLISSANKPSVTHMTIAIVLINLQIQACVCAHVSMCVKSPR